MSKEGLSKGKYDKEEYKEKKQQEIKKIVDSIEDGIKSFMNSDKYKEYLKVMSKFHNYSANNSVLIWMQKKDASVVAGFNTWKSLNRVVKRGEKAISILAPAPIKIKKEVEVINPITHKKEKEIQESKIMRFKKVNVFDISQTEGEPLPKLTNELKGDFKELDVIRASVKSLTNIDVEYEDIKGGSKGYFSLLDNRIVLKKGLSEVQQAKTMIHECAHAILHKNLREDGISRDVAETQAESVAFVVSNHFGLDTSEYSFPYLASWSRDEELTSLKESLKVIQDTSSNIINTIEEKLKELDKDMQHNNENTLANRIESIKAKDVDENNLESNKKGVYER